MADNTYRDGSSELNNTEASFIKDGGVSVDQRKMNAVRAYFEWMVSKPRVLSCYFVLHDGIRISVESSNKPYTLASSLRNNAYLEIVTAHSTS